MTLEKVEKSADAVLAEIIAKGVTDAELERAKNAYIAEYIYENDNQATLARRYGWGLAVGRSVAEIDSWPAEIAKVTAEQVKSVAATYLDLRRSVTGELVPVQAESSTARGAPATTKNPT